MENENRTKSFEALSRLEENLQKFVVRFNEVKKENSELKLELLNLKGQLEELNNALIEKEKEIENLKIQLEKARNTVIISEKERQNLKNRISEILERIEVYLTNN